jgi:hypothetical protein
MCRLELDVAGAVHALPPEAHAGERAGQRLEDDQVHELPVDELL